MSDFTLTIDGRAVPSERTFDVINPATGAPFAACPDAGESHLDAAVEAAGKAFGDWRQDEAARRKRLNDAARVLAARARDLSETLTREQGKPRRDALYEIMGASRWFGATAGLEIPRSVIQDDAKGRVEVRRRPLGVVAAITPWNYPVILSVWKVAPALLAGNTVVLKPSPHTPLSTLRLGEVLREVFPPGVLNVLSGGDALGAQMTAHPGVRMISFTGSVATGKRVRAAAVPDLKRVVLELGGNDPALVLPDVDPKAVAEKLFWGAFENNGQVCTAIKRLYAHEAIFHPLVEEMAALSRGVKVGDGMDPATRLGPVNNRPQFERIQALVEESRRMGARVVTGGCPLDGPGYFYPPTLVTDISEAARLVQEEQFGPVLPILPFRDTDDALARANATPFGLGGSVWTADPARGADLAARLDCGVAWVNQHNAVAPDIPIGGRKWSGIGCHNGPQGLEAFSEIQVVSAAR